MEPNFKITTEFSLKNMMSKSCIRLINVYFANVANVTVKSVELGRVIFEYEPKDMDAKRLEQMLLSLGFPQVFNDDEKKVEQIKIAAIELIHYAYNANSLIRNSDYLEERLQMPYGKLSKLFSDQTGITLEKYIIALKIEKVKELIVNQEHTLSEIAYMLGYSSVHYLSNQFKKITGVTVSEFKKSPEKLRIPVDELI